MPTEITIPTEEDILAHLEREAGLRGKTPSTLCNYALNDGELPRRLREGRSITLRTARRLFAYLAKDPE